MISQKLRRKIAIAMIAAGVIIALIVGYQFVGTNIVSRFVASQETAKLIDQFAKANSSIPALVEPDEGSAFALMTIPRLGDDVRNVPVIQGIAAEDLDKGVGHYPGTAMPGGLGNFAVAGHRATHGEPFANFQNLRAGDEVLVETADATYVYKLEFDEKVKPKGTWVIDANPVPGKFDSSRKLITLTTCEPKWNSTKRWVWWGSLSAIRQKKL